MQEVYRRIEKVAPTSATVLITGESGSGKELVARTIHDRSQNAHAPFVAVNCGAIPANLIEAELFGYEKGAFTGAARHASRLLRARGGRHAVPGRNHRNGAGDAGAAVAGARERAGSPASAARPKSGRACASWPPPTAIRSSAVQDGQLREDLMYRLAVFPIGFPPLREREGDAELLAEHFLQQLNAAEGTAKAYSRQAIMTVRSHRWPGQRPRAQECGAACIHPGRRRGRAGFRGPRLCRAHRQLPQASRWELRWQNSSGR